MNKESSNVLDQAIAQIADESVRSRVAREVELLRGSRRFGLVFDRHLPESVRLPDHPIRKGVKVGLRDESTDETWRVTQFADTSRTVALLDGDGGERPVGDLVAIREFGEPIFPGLKSVDRIQNGDSDAPWHTVINGENFHVLQALKSTHLGKVDLIYIDPPYNTGNEGWIYNDRYVAEQDRAKSSKWLSFLERRLLIARDLLKPTGVIIVAIGDSEHHRLRLLMDQVLDEKNFLSDVVWQGGRKNDSRYVSNGADYMLIYARDEASLTENDVRWREPRLAQDEMLAAGVKCWEEAKQDPATATVLMKRWIRSLPINHPARENNRFYEFDPGTGRVFRKDNVSWPGGGGPTYDVRHPITGMPVKVPGSGWRYPKPERMHEMIDAGRILFGPDHTHYINRKLYLDEANTVVAESVFNQKRTSAATRLKAVLGDKRFPNPKDHEVLMRWIGLAAPRDAVILDFFGGSGSTSEAVVRLNAEDAGTRQSILVTNNEVGSKQAKALRKAGKHPGNPEWEELGVFEYVTRPRIRTVVTGTRPDGTSYSEGLAANVEFFDLTYLDPGMVRRGCEFDDIAPLMWLEAGALGKRIDEEPREGWALTSTYGVLFSSDALAPFADAVAEAAKSDVVPQLVFVVTDSPVEYQTAAERMPAGMETVRLYSDYLTNYTINTESTSR